MTILNRDDDVCLYVVLKTSLSDSSGSDQSTNHIPIIVGVFVAVVLLIVIIVVVVVVMFLRKSTHSVKLILTFYASVSLSTFCTIK